MARGDDEPVSPQHAAARNAAKLAHVFPCAPGKKRPLTKDGFKSATQDLQQIEAWWRKRPDANPAICPDPAGLCVIDIDGEDGERSWEAICLMHGEPPQTRIVKTPKGRHLYFRGSLPASQGRLAKGIDTRGRGSYALAPGAIVGGVAYTVENSAEPAPLPAWVTAALNAKPEPRDPSPLAGAPLTPAQLELMLAHLNPDAERADWIEVAAGLHAATCTDDAFDKRDLFQRWSRGEVGAWPAPSRWTGDDDAGATYDTLPPREGGITAGTLIKKARDAGWNDEADGSGFAAIPAQVTALKQSRFVFLNRAQQSTLPAPEWLVPALLPRASIGLLYGAPGSYKSFVALDIALSLAARVGALGCDAGAAPEPSLYLAGEGPNGIAKKRVPAWLHSNGLWDDPGLPFYLCPTVFALSNAADRTAFTDALSAAPFRPALIVIDTAARALAGLDENSAKDAGVLIDAAESLKRDFDAAILIVHHSGKDAQKGARGSSAIEAGVDTVIRAEADRDALSVKLTVTKQKDADPGEPIFLKGAPVRESLAFRRISADDFRSLTALSDELTPAVVRRSLIELGATSGNKATNTDALATEILRGRGALPSEPQERRSAVGSVAQRLKRAARGDLLDYASKDSGKTSPWCWFVRSADVEE